MYSLVLSLLAAAASVVAQQPVNQILSPGANSVIQAGGGVQTITWTNISPGNVSISLFSGANPVVEVVPIAASVVNTGTFLWTPETWLPSANDYTIGVTDLSAAANPTQYTPYFTVQLCSTCSSSTRATTSSFSAQTVSVSGLALGTRTQLAFPSVASAAQTVSSANLGSGVAGASSGNAASRTAAANLGGASVAARASSLGASNDAILSMTGTGVGAVSGISAAASSAASTAAAATRSGASQRRGAGAWSALFCAFGLFAGLLVVL